MWRSKQSEESPQRLYRESTGKRLCGDAATAVETEAATPSAAGKVRATVGGEQHREMKSRLKEMVKRAGEESW